MRWSRIRKRAPNEQFVLYSNADCSLCAKAGRLARDAVGSAGVRVMDISGDRVLEDLYIFRVPVLCYLDVVLAEGSIDEREIRRAIEAAHRLDRQTK